MLYHHTVFKQFTMWVRVHKPLKNKGVIMCSTCFSGIPAFSWTTFTTFKTESCIILLEITRSLRKRVGQRTRKHNEEKASLILRDSTFPTSLTMSLLLTSSAKVPKWSETLLNNEVSPEVIYQGLPFQSNFKRFVGLACPLGDIVIFHFCFLCLWRRPRKVISIFSGLLWRGDTAYCMSALAWL